MKRSEKKILFVSPYFKPQTGGLENYVSSIQEGLSGLGWKTIVVTSNAEGEPYREEDIGGAKVYRLPVWFRLSNTPMNPLWYFALKKIIRRERPDIINAHAPVPFIADMAAFAAKDVPFVLTYHAGTMRKRKVLMDAVIWLYESSFLRHTARKAVRIICPSRFVVRTMLGEFEDKTTVISPGIDTSLFRPASPDVGRTGDAIFVGRYANMYEMKGLYDLIGAIERLPDVRLTVVGEPVSSGASNVTFVGTKNLRELVDEMQGKGVLILPSRAHAESFGMVLIEAMACKVPVIGTDIGGIPEVIENGTDGIIVPPEDRQALTSAIRSILTDRRLADTLTENAYEKVTRNFTWIRKVEETERIFDAILAASECELRGGIPATEVGTDQSNK